MLVLLAPATHGQGYYFRHYQVENGLSNNTVFCSVQDSRGFLWLGTKDGVNRFDGMNFKVFRPDPADSTSLGNNFVYSIHEDKRKVLWLGTREGLYRFNPSKENFTFIKGTGWSDVRDIDSDKDGNLWFIVGLRLYRYNEEKDSIPEGIEADSTLIGAISIEKDGTLWAATSEGLLKKYHKDSHSFSTFSLFNKSAPATSHWVEDIFCTSQGYVLIATSNQGIKRFSTINHTYKDILTYNEDHTEIYGREFAHYSGDEYWMATESGIYIYNLRTDSVINLRKRNNDPYSITDNAVYTLCRDKEGGMWAGTYFGGVNYYPRQYTSFQKFFPDQSANSISGNAVREICEDMYGHLWIGTEDGGLNKLDQSTGRITHYLPGSQGSNISYSNVHGLLPVGRELWIGTFEHGLDVMDIPTGKVIRHYSGGGAKSSFRGNFILTLYRTREGEILAGTPLGLYHYLAGEDHFEAVAEVPENLFIYSILEDRKGTIWIGTIGQGVVYYNRKTGEKGNLLHNPADKKSIGCNLVNNVYEDSHGHLWFSTEGSGLMRYDHDTQSSFKYNTQNGLPSNFVFKVLEDSSGMLWVSTTRGLTCLNPHTGSSKVYTKANGLLSDQFNYNSGYKDSKGRMYFGSVKGLISFNPDEFTQNRYAPPVYITGFQVNNTEVSIRSQDSPLQESIISTHKIVLTHTQSSFSIDFAALSYTAPEMTQYAYMMEGLDKDWTSLTVNRKVYFTDLSPGTYRFKVKAANSSGFWNSRDAILEIKILPPWWTGQYAYLAYTVIAFLLIWYIIRSYHQRTEEKNRRKIELLEHEKEKELYQAKIEFFTNVAHEIKTPLTLIKGPLEKVIRKTDEQADIHNSLRIMERNTNRLVDLTNQLLDFRQTETKGFSLSFQPVNMTELLEELFINFKPLAEQNSVQYKMDMPTIPLIVPADQEAINKILSNLFSNAIKYADKEVRITLQPVQPGEQDFRIEISNDGQLIPADMREKVFEPFFRLKRIEKQKGTGIGLALARSLAELHKGKLYLKEGTGMWNTFVLSLPWKNEPDSNGQPDEQASASAR